MSKARTDDEYAAMADAIETGDYTVVGPAEMGSTLRMGRPRGRDTRSGNTPVRSFRLPEELTAALDARAESEHVPASEITRRALVEYLKR